MLSGFPDGTVDLDEARRLLEGARLLVVNAVSNVLGTLLPLRELAAAAHDAGALVLVDAAQSAGHVPADHAAEGADMIAFTRAQGAARTSRDRRPLGARRGGRAPAARGRDRW